MLWSVRPLNMEGAKHMKKFVLDYAADVMERIAGNTLMKAALKQSGGGENSPPLFFVLERLANAMNGL